MTRIPGTDAIRRTHTGCPQHIHIHVPLPTERTSRPARSCKGACPQHAVATGGLEWLQDPRDHGVRQAGRELALRVARAPRAHLVLLQRRRQRAAAERARRTRHPPAQPRLHIPPHPRRHAAALLAWLDPAPLKQPLDRTKPRHLLVVLSQNAQRALESRQGPREVPRVEVRLDKALPRAAVPRVNVRGFGGLRGGAVPVAAADVDERRVGVREGVGLDFVRLVVELECDFGVARLVRLVAWNAAVSLLLLVQADECVHA